VWEHEGCKETHAVDASYARVSLDEDMNVLAVQRWRLLPSSLDVEGDCRDKR
jgi:hypothetical protein